MKYSDIDVNSQNYKRYKYLKYYCEGKLEGLSNEELKAQVFHIRDIYRGIKSPCIALKRLSLEAIAREFKRRDIFPRFKI
jgi:hypothetical protein